MRIVQQNPEKLVTKVRGSFALHWTIITRICHGKLEDFRIQTKLFLDDWRSLSSVNFFRYAELIPEEGRSVRRLKVKDKIIAVAQKVKSPSASSTWICAM
jgi:hypothetical protein